MKERHILKKKQREKISEGDTVYKIAKAAKQASGMELDMIINVLSINPKGIAELKGFNSFKLRQKVSVSHLKLQRSRPVHFKPPSSTNLTTKSS